MEKQEFKLCVGREGGGLGHNLTIVRRQIG